MTTYQLRWITDNLATGHAPMSYEQLDEIRAQGIDAIVNLCGEFCDLHEIEETSGFEVYYLPIPDECAPNMAEMEKALEWLDEAFYLGKKVLVHCRHGIGRTGTFVTSYLLRRGLGLKKAEKKLKKNPARPSNYSQWKLLKKYGKKEGTLKIREPSLESRNVVDLGVFFSEYESVLARLDEALEKAVNDHACSRCGLDTDACCTDDPELTLIEAIYLHVGLNRTLKSRDRMSAIERAVAEHRKVCRLKKTVCALPNVVDSASALTERFRKEKILCSLSREGKCIGYPFRPVACRLYGLPENTLDSTVFKAALSKLSGDVFFAFAGGFLQDGALSFSLAETVSGKFIQRYFYYLANVAPANK